MLHLHKTRKCIVCYACDLVVEHHSDIGKHISHTCIMRQQYRHNVQPHDAVKSDKRARSQRRNLVVLQAPVQRIAKQSYNMQYEQHS